MAATYNTPNQLTGTADWSGGWLHGITGKPLGTWPSMVVDGDTVTVTGRTWEGPDKYVAVKAGETWAFSAEVRGNDCGGIFAIVPLNSATENGHAKAECTQVSSTGANPPTGEWQVVCCVWKMTSDGYIRPRAECSANTGTMQIRHYMLTRTVYNVAYAPARDETLACAAPAATPTNLLAGLYAGDSISSEDTKESDERFWRQNVTMDVVEQNACAHVGYGLSVASAATDTTGVNMSVRLVDLAEHVNYVNVDAVPANRLTKDVRRVCTDFVIPAGQRVAQVVMCKGAATTQEVSVWHPSLSIGGAVPLASSAHTPYATEDHVSVTYATKASLKVTDDSVKAEVEERGKLAGRVGTLESTSGTHASKLEQLATSIKSLVKGESTYTDPDGKSATSGIYSLVTQTRDSVTALFGSYTKTADLASTQAVKDAKKAGTDAQAAASAAQTTADSAKSTAQAAASDAATAKTNAASAVSTANSASTSAANAVETANAASSTASSASSTANSAASTANAAKTSAASAVSTANSASSTASSAKSTADSLATLIRADSTGITVGKSADGQTWSTGRTRMTDSAFQVLDKAGVTITQLAGDGASFLAGLVRIVAGKVTLPGNLKVNSITIDSGGGVAVLRGIVSSISANLDGFTSSVSAGWEEDFGHGVTAIVREDAHLEPGKMVPERMASTHLASDKAELSVGDNSMEVTGDSFSLSHPEYLLSALMDTRKYVSDLNTCGPGVFSYKASTANRPTDYGVCLSFVAGSGSWLFQVALPTVGDPHWRRNINGAEWTSWWTITSQ